MKRTLTTSIFLCLSYMNVMTARPITIPYSFPEERVNAFSEANDDWALLGEVTTTAQNQDPWVEHGLLKSIRPWTESQEEEYTHFFGMLSESQKMEIIIL